MGRGGEGARDESARGGKDRQTILSGDASASPTIPAVPVAPVNKILRDPANTKARWMAAILDPCRGATAIRTEAGRVVAKLMADAEGRITFASCGMEEQSFEDEKTQHGIFTRYLVQDLRGGADANGDGLIGIGRETGDWRSWNVSEADFQQTVVGKAAAHAIEAAWPALLSDLADRSR